MESFESVIWFSDIRGFSAMSSIMQPQEIIEVLNTYYDAIIPAVHKYGGEVLKFLGDGLLAVFPVEEGTDAIVKLATIGKEYDVWLDASLTAAKDQIAQAKK